MHIVSHPRNGNMSSIYTLIPRPICDFAHLDAVTRYTFGLIWDRWSLSYKPENREKYSDHYGIFCFYEREAIAAEIGITLPTLRKSINALIDAGLLRVRRSGYGAAYRYYITERAWDHMNGAHDDAWWLPMEPGEGLDPVRLKYSKE